MRAPWHGVSNPAQSPGGGIEDFDLGHRYSALSNGGLMDPTVFVDGPSGGGGGGRCGLIGPEPLLIALGLLLCLRLSKGFAGRR
jgi:hypothetical protein